jgi:hypothetical protein
MGTPIPALCAQIFIDADTDGAQVDAGAVSLLVQTHYYYFVSNVPAAIDGQSLMSALQNALDASDGTNAWFVNLSSDYKVQLSHTDTVSAHTVTFDALLATYLGFTSASFSVGANTTVKATYRARWFWSPDQPINETGPVRFDPSLRHAAFSSAGATQRSTDGTAAYVKNGEQGDATYTFLGIEGAQKFYPQASFVNEDLEGFWRVCFSVGSRVLWWRDRDSTVGVANPSGGSSAPYKYIEYQPAEALRADSMFKPTIPSHLVYWDAVFPLWLTERYANTPGVEVLIAADSVLRVAPDGFDIAVWEPFQGNLSTASTFPNDQEPSVVTPLTVIGATNATPIVVQTSVAHGLVTGQSVRITGVNGNTAANGFWDIIKTAADKFSLQAHVVYGGLGGANSVGNGAWTSGGTCYATAVVLTAAFAPAYAAPGLFQASGDIIFPGAAGKSVSSGIGAVGGDALHDPLIATNGGVSFSLWVKLLADAAAGIVMAKQIGGGYSVLIGTAGNGAGTLWTPSIDTVTHGVVGSTIAQALTINKWVHVGITWDGNHLRTYRNGILVDTVTIGGGPFEMLYGTAGAPELDPWLFGGRTQFADLWTNCSIADVRISNALRTAAYFTGIYQAAGSP